MGKPVARELAEKEVTSWLDKKKVMEADRERSKDSIEQLIEAMEEGILTLDDSTFDFTHKLLFPLDGVTEMKYFPRLNDRMLKPYLNGVKSGDADGRLLAYVAALTKQPRAILETLDTADKKISMAIAIFFL